MLSNKERKKKITIEMTYEYIQYREILHNTIRQIDINSEHQYYPRAYTVTISIMLFCYLEKNKIK